MFVLWTLKSRVPPPFLLENINGSNDNDINTSETITNFLTLKAKTSRESAQAKRFKVKFLVNLDLEAVNISVRVNS